MLSNDPIITIAGPVGGLETIYIAAAAPERGVAVINHPNPRQGGTNTNKVIQMAAKALSQLGFHCYLPNLRGVGNSEGEHDYGDGEVADCLAVVAYAQAQHPQAQKLAISGFSFGGYVALWAAQTAQPDLLLLLGPALGMYRRTEPSNYDVEKTVLIHGSDDDVVPLNNALAWAEPQGLPVVVLAGASHFFHGKLIALRHTITRLAKPIVAEI